MEIPDSLPPSPLQEIRDPRLEERAIRLWIKRDDRLGLAAFPGDRGLSGNKWRKLKYNLHAARQAGQDTLLTFGGAHSNHIAAVASAGSLFGFQTIGFIRGEEPDGSTPTLRRARRCGMEIHFLSRREFRSGSNAPAVLARSEGQEGIRILPSGGSNRLALRGCRELVGETREQIPGKHADHWCAACGTGATFAGCLSGLDATERAVGFSALKGAFMASEIQKWTEALEHPPSASWSVCSAYSFGGFARATPVLIQFIRDFREAHGICLDPIYTGKLLYGLFDLIGRGSFPEGSRIIAYHSGGLQGLAGWNARFRDHPDMQVNPEIY